MIKSTDNWEKEFDREFGKLYSDEHNSQFASVVEENERLKQFIRQLLQTQREELVEKIKDEMEEKTMEETDSQILDRLWDYLDSLTSNKEGEE